MITAAGRVPAGQTYNVRVYLTNPRYTGAQTAHDNFDVMAEGVTRYHVDVLNPGETEIAEFAVMTANDLLEIRFVDRGGSDPVFVVAGIEIFSDEI